MPLRKMELEGIKWVHLARDRDWRRAVVKTVMNIRFIKVGSFQQLNYDTIVKNSASWNKSVS
jgi:hypothetical protein